MEQKLKRESGYYWVKWLGEWTVVRWAPRHILSNEYYFHISADAHSSVTSDTDPYITEINETRIKSPDEIGSDKFKTFTDRVIGEDYIKAENPDEKQP